MKPKKNDNEYNAAFDIVSVAIQKPMQQIIENAGMDYGNIVQVVENENSKIVNNYGYDVKNEKFGDLYKLGIIDPLKVTKNALINASSVATTILSTNAIITHARMLKD